jgi:hypothetical protein
MTAEYQQRFAHLLRGGAGAQARCGFKVLVARVCSAGGNCQLKSRRRALVVSEMS